MYELKSEYEELCCPFFYHYTRPDHSKVGTGLDTSVHVMSCTYLTAFQHKYFMNVICSQAEEIRRKKIKAIGATKVTGMCIHFIMYIHCNVILWHSI